MGIDFLDMTFRFERTFKIKLDRSETNNLLSQVAKRGDRDLTVKELVAWVESHVQAQNLEFEGDVFEIARREIATCLGFDEDEIKADSWLVKDLHMS